MFVQNREPAKNTGTCLTNGTATCYDSGAAKHGNVSTWMNLDNRIPARQERNPGEARDDTQQRAKGAQVQLETGATAGKEERPWGMCQKRPTPARKGKITW